MNILPEEITICISEVSEDLLNMVYIYSSEIEEGKTYKCRITYPLSTVCEFDVRGSWNIVPMIVAICNKYREIYEEEISYLEEGKEKWGIWGHSIEDLVIEGIELDEDRLILSIGS